ncbi:von Willebrand factor A domain-containing protein 5A-like [Pelmatolapia mariae]|uniref:von Willebrand factor A domain-containing protein 5A-like n=1 Tax=Pelmatolapia mariae TaxID=158779 RepID=UPI002FE6346C
MRSVVEPDSYEPTNKSDSKKGLFTHMKKKLSVFWKSRKTSANYDDAHPKFVSEAAVQMQPPRDPLLQLVSLQEASGCWLLDPALATALGKTSKEMEKSKPEKGNNEVWATVLALIWLHAFKMDAKDEWELLAMKAASWLRAQNAPCVSECVDAGNVLLGSSVKKEALGL